MASCVTDLAFPALWASAMEFDRFVDEASTRQDLWRAVYRLARIPDWALDEARERAGLHLLVLAEDWCGDAFNSIPVLARLADLSGHIDLRLLRRDEHPDLMDRYLTDGTRSIPIVIVLDEEFRELGHWGPRPSELQCWALEHASMPKDESYPLIRRWYARDKGETMLREVLGVRG